MIVIAGLSHRTSPIEIREALAFSKDGLQEALRRMREEAGLLEAMILSTCNRVELYGWSNEPTSGDRLREFLCRFHHRALENTLPYLYTFSGEEAVRHAFRVAASLDSMVVGEPQILGQVKEAYQRAVNAGTLGAVLGTLRDRSLSAAKRARSETGIGENAVSVSSVAVELARKIFAGLQDRKVLLIGAGKMTELAARQLVKGGASATVLGGRTFERAAELARALGGEAAPFESLHEQLAVADIVISGTGAPGVVVAAEDVEQVRKARHHRPLFLIDIAVPRDVDPSVRKLEGVFLYDVDDLKSVAESNLRERRKQAAAAESLVDREVREYVGWQKTRDVLPLLLELRQRGDEIRKAEIERVRKRLGTLSAEQEQALDAATAAIVNKLLHPPTVGLKEIARNGHAADVIGLVRKLLGL
jgi:glutamyl-tRNA reductase